MLVLLTASGVVAGTALLPASLPAARGASWGKATPFLRVTPHLVQSSDRNQLLNVEWVCISNRFWKAGTGATLHYTLRSLDQPPNPDGGARLFCDLKVTGAGRDLQISSSLRERLISPSILAPSQESQVLSFKASGTRPRSFLGKPPVLKLLVDHPTTFHLPARIPLAALGNQRLVLEVTGK